MLGVPNKVGTECTVCHDNNPAQQKKMQFKHLEK